MAFVVRKAEAIHTTPRHSLQHPYRCQPNLRSQAGSGDLHPTPELVGYGLGFQHKGFRTWQNVWPTAQAASESSAAGAAKKQLNQPPEPVGAQTLKQGRQVRGVHAAWQTLRWPFRPRQLQPLGGPTGLGFCPPPFLSLRGHWHHDPVRSCAHPARRPRWRHR